MKRSLIIIGAVVFFVVAAVFALRVSQAKARNADRTVATTRVPVRTTKVANKDMPQLVQITGTVRAKSEAALFAKMPGRVVKVNVEVGSVVKQGDVLAALEGAEFGWRVKQAEAQLMQARAGFDQSQVNQKTATASFGRATSLHQKNALSQVDFESAEAGFALAGVAVRAAQAQVALAEAAVGLANQSYADSRITAPFAGVIARKNIEIGTQLSPALTAFVLQDQGSLKVLGTVSATEVALLKSGMTVRVTVDELPGVAVDGTLASVAPSLDDTTRRAAVEISLKPTEALLPYMFGRASIAFGTRKDALVIPATAILPSADGPIVYVVKNDVATLIKPRVGARIDDDVFIEGGLNEGDNIVISGDTGLRDGIAVTVDGVAGTPAG